MFRSGESGGQASSFPVVSGCPKTRMRFPNFPIKIMNTFLVQWIRTPFCMHHILSKSWSLCLTGMKMFFKISTYHSVVILPTTNIGPIVPCLDIGHYTITVEIGETSRSRNSQSLKCSSFAHSKLPTVTFSSANDRQK